MELGCSRRRRQELVFRVRLAVRSGRRDGWKGRDKAVSENRVLWRARESLGGSRRVGNTVCENQLPRMNGSDGRGV